MLYPPRPHVADSTREERLAYVLKRYECIANCDLCGNCAVFRGMRPEDALSDFIEGNMELSEALRLFRDRGTRAR